MRNKFPDEDFDLWILFNEVRFLLFSPRDEEIKPLKITHSQAWALVAIKASKYPLTVTELSHWLGCKPPTATVLLNRMEESSLIKKERDEKNHKLVKVYITETGERIFKELSHSQVVSDAFKVLDSSDREQLRSLLEKLRGQIISSILTKRKLGKQSVDSTSSLTS
ncbi:MAG: MarR family winged helix-turn-helix transcriptional regulator [Dehalococcoidia bacterium]